MFTGCCKENIFCLRAATIKLFLYLCWHIFLESLSHPTTARLWKKYPLLIFSRMCFNGHFRWLFATFMKLMRSRGCQSSFILGKWDSLHLNIRTWTETKTKEEQINIFRSQIIYMRPDMHKRKLIEENRKGGVAAKIFHHRFSFLDIILSLQELQSSFLFLWSLKWLI